MTIKSLFVLLALAFAVASQAVTLQYSSDVNYIPTAGAFTTGLTSLAPDHVYRITSSMTQASKAKSLIEAMKPDWTVSLGADAPGLIQVTQYAAYQEYWSSGPVRYAGVRLKFDYYSSASSLSDYRFVQVVYTNTAPSGAPTNGYIDPWENDDPTPYVELPWYWTEPEHGTRMGSGSYHFEDQPKRSYNGTNAITWGAACFLVETGFNTVTIRDGVYWGWGTSSMEEEPIGGGGGDTDKAYFDKGGLQAVPEPSTMAFLLPLVALLRRRRGSR